MQANSSSFFRFFSASRAFKYISLSICTLLVTVSFCLLPAISSPPDDSNVPIHVIGQIRLEIPDDKYEEYKLKTTKLFSETEEKDRPRLYTCNRDINDPNLYVWNEEWQSFNVLQKHLNSAHFKNWYSYVKKYQIGNLDVIYAPVSAFKNV